MNQKRTHVIACADAWLKDAGQPTYTELLQKVESMTNTTAAQPLDLDKLSGDIMNLPCTVPRAIAASGASKQAYKEGHRDARHAAAELVTEQAAQARAARLDTTASASDGAIYEAVSRRADPEGHAEATAQMDEVLGRAAQPVQADAAADERALFMRYVAIITGATSLGENRVYDLATALLDEARATLAPVAAQQMNALMAVPDDKLDDHLRAAGLDPVECETVGRRALDAALDTVAAQQVAANAPVLYVRRADIDGTMPGSTVVASKVATEEWTVPFHAAAKAPAAQAVAKAEQRTSYDELIYAVARKFPGESRHQTALRYIRQAESMSHQQTQARPKSNEGDKA